MNKNDKTVQHYKSFFGVKHELKILSIYLDAVIDPDPDMRKQVEIRKNDRTYQVGDVLMLREWDPKTQTYLKRFAICKVTHILSEQPYLPEGYVALSIRLVTHYPHGW